MNGIKKSLSCEKQTGNIPTVVQKYDEGIGGNWQALKLRACHIAQKPSIHKLVHIDDEHTINQVVVWKDDRMALMVKAINGFVTDELQRPERPVMS